jgi:hypothetical protein
VHFFTSNVAVIIGNDHVESDIIFINRIWSEHESGKYWSRLPITHCKCHWARRTSRTTVAPAAAFVNDSLFAGCGPCGLVELK